jgi:hypothetical protein
MIGLESLQAMGQGKHYYVEVLALVVAPGE